MLTTLFFLGEKNTLEMQRTYEHRPICHWTDVALSHALQERKVA